MWCIKDPKLLDYLWERGMLPVFETGNAAFYYTSYDLHQLLESFYIREVCIPNKKGRKNFQPL